MSIIYSWLYRQYLNLKRKIQKKIGVSPSAEFAKIGFLFGVGFTAGKQKGLLGAIHKVPRVPDRSYTESYLEWWHKIKPSELYEYENG